MPTIRHRSGPLAATQRDIDPAADRITFGRDPAACDVVYPSDLTVVARRHFALVRKPSGVWTYEGFGAPYVAIDGAPAENGQAVPSGAKVELGRQGGPSFEIAFEGKSFAADLPATDVQDKVAGRRAAAAGARRFAIIATALALVAVLGVSLLWFLSRNEGARLEQAVAALQKTQTDAAADTISASVRDRLLQSAFVVVARLKDGRWIAFGSASPISADTLATNAHVAAVRDQLGPDDKVFVRAPGKDGKTYEVIETVIHPGFAAFARFLNEDPLFVTEAKSCAACIPSPLSGTLGYDVALLRVAKDANLGPVIPIASREELLALRPGMPVGIAGYPLEDMKGSEIQGMQATPNLRTGTISALTDVFYLPSDAARQRHIHHNIPVTGGNSGSPMIAGSGKLIALVNSINLVPVEGAQGGRMPNAAIVNFAQRADYLTELLDGTAEKNLEAERTYWARQTASFKRGFDVIVPEILKEKKPPNSAGAKLVSEARFSMTKGEQIKAKTADGTESTGRQRIHKISIDTNTPGIFIVYAQRGVRSQLFLVENGKIAGHSISSLWFPNVAHAATAGSSVDAYVVTPDQDVDYTLLQYRWE